jgi:hypothetical protein
MDRVRVISLERTPERWAAFEATNRGVVEWELAVAVDGLTVDRAALLEQGLATAADL